MKALFGLLIVLAIFAGGAAYYATHLSADPPPSFRTVTVKRDTLVLKIGATGTAEPEELIDVGSQVTGKIQSFGRDPHDPSKTVDYCTAVEKGTVLATIDPTVYKAQVDQAAAALAHAKADLLQLEAKCFQTEQEWKRAKVLLPQKAIANTDYELARANWLVAKANVNVGVASIKQSEAALAMAQTNLDYCTIKSPLKGVVVTRRVNVGQTVVAAMNAQSICLLAKDLRRMQIWASVNEADIGRIRVGLPVHYTLNTFPGETFDGKVTQVRINGQSTQNVVTYTVVVTTDNPPSPDHPFGKLLPFMTADVRFEVERHPDVLLAPNAALRWKPQPAQIAPDAAAETSDGAKASAEGEGSTPTKDKSTHQKRSRLWVHDGTFVRPIEVSVGATDDSVTEVSGDDVKEGMKVVIGESRGDQPEDGDGTTNPFLPKIRGPQTKPKQ